MCPLWKKLTTLFELELGAIAIFLGVFAIGTFLGRFSEDTLTCMKDSFFVFINVATLAIIAIAIISILLCGWRKCLGCDSKKK